MITLDQDVPKIGWTEVDFLKIDAEGYDLDVMRGAKNLFEKQAIRFLQFEYGGTWQAAGFTLKAALDFLQAHGYQPYLIRKNGLSLFNWERYGEYFSFSNFFAFQARDAKLFGKFLNQRP